MYNKLTKKDPFMFNAENTPSPRNLHLNSRCPFSLRNIKRDKWGFESLTQYF